MKTVAVKMSEEIISIINSFNGLDTFSEKVRFFIILGLLVYHGGVQNVEMVKKALKI